MRGVEEKGVDVGQAGQRMSRCSLGGFSHLITQSSLARRGGAPPSHGIRTSDLMCASV